MSQISASLTAILDLEQLERNLFRGRSPKSSWPRVFGGQVIAQSLYAACKTVEGRQPHSLHAYFLLAGDPEVPIVYEVDRLRDGRSFTTRRVLAVQKGEAIFAMSASFHVEEAGYEHQMPMPKVPMPEELPDREEMVKLFSAPEHNPLQTFYQRKRPIEIRPVELERWPRRRQPGTEIQRLDPRDRAVAGRAGLPPERAGLCFRPPAARFQPDRPWRDGLRPEDSGRQPRSCPMVPPAVPGR